MGLFFLKVCVCDIRFFIFCISNYIYLLPDIFYVDGTGQIS